MVVLTILVGAFTGWTATTATAASALGAELYTESAYWVHQQHGHVEEGFARTLVEPWAVKRSAHRVADPLAQVVIRETSQTEIGSRSPRSQLSVSDPGPPGEPFFNCVRGIYKGRKGYYCDGPGSDGGERKYFVPDVGFPEVVKNTATLWTR